MENEFNIPLDIGDCVAFDKVDGTKGSEPSFADAVVEAEEIGSESERANSGIVTEEAVELSAGIAVVSGVSPTFCPLSPEVLSSGGSHGLKKIHSLMLFRF